MPRAGEVPEVDVAVAAPIDIAAPADGRHVRRERNRDAVVTAMLGLYREGVVTPSSEQIAGRAGVSARSVFRYFADVDDLAREAIARQQQHLAPLWDLGLDPDAPLGDRIVAFVAGRVRLLDGMGEVGRVARHQAVRQPLIGAELDRVRRLLRAQTRAAFAPELDPLAPTEAAAVLSAIDALTSWEAHDLMLHDQQLSPAEVQTTLALALRRLLQADGGAR